MTRSPNAITVLLVEDAPDIRELLRVSMDRRGAFEVLGEAESGHAATVLAARLRPDVIVLDLGLPDLPARDLLARIRRASPTSRIVVFSGEEMDRPWFEQRSDGYVAKGSDHRELLDLLEEIGRGYAHDQGAVELPRDVVAPAEARLVVRDLLRRWGYDSLVEQAALVVSELVTNAIEHAGSECAVLVRRSEHGVRIEVRDGGEGMPDPQRPMIDAEGGRGLLIVSSLATAWGVRNEAHSKSVWVELAAPAA